MVIRIDGEAPRVYTIEIADGIRYLIYNASELGKPADHAPNKWNFYPYRLPLTMSPSESFDPSELAEAAVVSAARRTTRSIFDD